MSKVAIIGYGHVGKSMQQIFPDSVIYDKYIADHQYSQDEVNKCRLGIVCVPTPSLPDGSCDTSAVEEVVSWLETPLVLIKSTVPPGTTDYLREEYGKHIAFSPEYFGEHRYYVPPEFSPLGWTYLIIGGCREDTQEMTEIFLPRLGPDKNYVQTDARTAELTKYMDNVWLAMQVTFANEFYDIATALAVDYLELRELWGMDPRVSKSHTAVFSQDRGFGGKCLPKDLHALIAAAQANGLQPILLKAIEEANQRFRSANEARKISNGHSASGRPSNFQKDPATTRPTPTR